MQQSPSDMQQHIDELRDKLRKVKEERDRAHRELEETEWKVFASANDKTTIEILEAELDDARESEKRMLESLGSQTKQLELTKISLEEAKLEIASLQDTIQVLESAPETAASSGDRGGRDAKRLNSELRLALAAEEKSKKAMDGLALALKEVTTESNSSRQLLMRAQHELEAARGEADRLRTSLKRKDDKLRAAADEASRLKTDAEESFTAWRGKEAGFIACMKASEEELADVWHENSRLLESQRAARDEISKLRDILKQAIRDANVVKEALEMARSENSQLKDMIGDKDNAIKCIKQELECLKVSEAAALDSVKELQSLLVATSNSSVGAKAVEEDVMSPPRPMALPVLTKYPSEVKIRPRGGIGHSFRDSERFEGSVFDLIGSPEDKRDRTKMVNFDEREHSVFSVMSRVHSRRLPVMRKVGSLLRWRSFHK